MLIEENKIIDARTSIFTENVENHGTIRNGVFKGHVENFGGIEDGEFFGDFNLFKYTEVSNGIFHGKFHQWAPSIVKDEARANIDGPMYITDPYGNTGLIKEKKA